MCCIKDSFISQPNFPLRSSSVFDCSLTWYPLFLRIVVTDTNSTCTHTIIASCSSLINRFFFLRVSSMPRTLLITDFNCQFLLILVLNILFSFFFSFLGLYSSLDPFGTLHNFNVDLSWTTSSVVSSKGVVDCLSL